MKELGMEEMGKVSGGYVVQMDDQFYIVRQDGSVIAPAQNEEDAIRFAKTFNTSPTVLTMEEYQKMFGRALEW